MGAECVFASHTRPLSIRQDISTGHHRSADERHVLQLNALYGVGRASPATAGGRAKHTLVPALLR